MEAAQLQVLVPIADDSEEIETACVTDTLVRAGAAVTVASVAPEGRLQVTMSRGLKLVADGAATDRTQDLPPRPLHPSSDNL